MRAARPNTTKQKAVPKTAARANTVADAEELLRIRKETLPEDHFNIGEAMRNLGWAYVQAGRSEDGLAMYQAINLT